MNWQLATYAVSENNLYFLNFMLERINGGLINKWHVQETDHANAILVDVDKPAGRQFWQTYQDSKTLIAFSWQNCYQTLWFLEKPLTNQSLIELLNRLSTEQWQRISSSSTSAITYFEPSWYLLGLLQGTLYMNQPRRFNCGHLPPVYVLPAERRCFTAPFDPNQLTVTQQFFFGAQSQEIEYVNLSVAELESQVRAGKLTMYRTETFLWLSALHASHGRLISGYTTKMPVRLKFWPNFNELPYQETYMTLAAFMSQNTTDLITVSTKTKVPLPTVINFFNACVVLDLIALHDHSKPIIKKRSLSKPKYPRLRQILKKIVNPSYAAMSLS